MYRWYEYCGRCEWWRYSKGVRGAATGDGKTEFIAALAALEFAGPPEIAPASPNVVVAAASFEQADRLFGTSATMLGGRDDAVDEAPLCGLFEVLDTQIAFRDGDPGSISRIAAVAGTNEGGIPTLFIGDELHEWGDLGDRKARVYVVVGKSLNKRMTHRGPGRQLGLSTAGFDVDHSLLGQLYKHGKKVERDPRVDPALLFDWQEAPDGLDFDKPEHREIAVRAASKAAGILWDVGVRVRAWDDPAMQHHEWLRYYANRWVNTADESWLAEHPDAWGKLVLPRFEHGVQAVLAVDMALKHDSVAVNRISKRRDGRIAVSSRVWRAADNGGRIDHVEVWQYIRDEAKKAPAVGGVVYDPRYFEVPARMLEDEGILAIEFDQSPARMAPACGLTFQLILDGTITHDGDTELAAHINAAVKRPLADRGFTLSKGKSKRHIDAAVATCMGVWVLHEVPLDYDVLLSVY